MQTGLLQLCLAVSLALLFACSDKDNDIITPEPPDASRVNLMELKPGQETMFVGYEQTCDSANFRWTGDTLVMTILEENGELFAGENYTPGSPSYQGSDWLAVYPINSESGTVTIPQRQQSRLFNFYGSDNIHLKPSDMIYLEQSGCLISTNDAIFVGDDIGHIEKFDFGPITIEDKTAVSCVPVIDVDAYLLYDRHQLYMSHQVTRSNFMGNALPTFVQGWVMI